MARSTGPVLITGGITFANKWIGNNQGPDFKILLATAVAAGILAGFEHAVPELAVGIAWIALVTSLLVKPRNGNSAVTNITRMSGL